MVTEALLGVVMGLLGWLGSLIPDNLLGSGYDPGSLADFFEYMADATGLLNDWFPLGVLIACIMAVAIAVGGSTIWGFLVWLFHQFWGSS